MLGFLKKLFGFDKETMKDAGVQIEQAPYKVEPPEPTVVATKPAAMTAKKKPRGPRKPQGQKPVQKPAAQPANKQPARRGRKPKAS
jgi:hypothetical protein